MADVRSLLRDERASRRISHPHVTYTKSGQIRCTVCNLFLKSEVLWDGHSRSKNHRQNVQATQSTSEASNGPMSKKRKLEDDKEDTRKRSKTAKGVSEGFFDDGEDGAGAGENDDHKDGSDASTRSESKEDSPAETERNDLPVPKPPDPAIPSVDEDEWAAFEREIVPLAQERPSTHQYTAATISAAPMTVAEVAAQENAAKRAKRDEEAEDEKEDAERKMEEEFDVMEEIAERVRRLKEKREALRDGAVPNDPAQADLPNEGDLDTAEQGQSAEQSSRESTEDEAEFDDWGFR